MTSARVWVVDERPPVAHAHRELQKDRTGLLYRPGWPLVAMIVGYPVLWVAGVASFAVQIFAVPMAIQLWRRGNIRVPPWFGVWLLFLLCSGLGILVLGVDPVGTVPDTFSGRSLAFAVRQSQYIASTVVVLYVGNLTEEELPVRRIVWAFGLFYVYVVIGGVLGLLWPHGSFPSLLEVILPKSLTAVPYVSQLVHPTFAQVQEFGDDALPRPSAPFPYTNIWGSSMALLSIWYVVHLTSRRSRRTYVIGALVLTTGLITIVYSLNRGVWLGLGLCLLYAVAAMGRRGHMMPLVGVVLSVLVMVTLLFASPLKQVIETRAENGKSDEIRAFTTARAIDLAQASPVVGFGSTRSAEGSATSIAVGKSPDCKNCGNVPIGINGYVWTLMVTTGFVGTALFFGFWVSQVISSRNDPSMIASASRLSLALSAFFGLFYMLDPIVPFVAIGLLWRGRAAS